MELEGSQVTKKYAEGLINLALYLANANQLNYAANMESSEIKIALIVLISLSIVLQIVVGILITILIPLDHLRPEKCQHLYKAISIINMVIGAQCTVINAIMLFM